MWSQGDISFHAHAKFRARWTPDEIRRACNDDVSSYWELDISQPTSIRGHYPPCSPFSLWSTIFHTALRRESSSLPTFFPRSSSPRSDTLRTVFPKRGLYRRACWLPGQEPLS